MCGIFGTYPICKEELNKARESLHTLIHRGPDTWGEWHRGSIYSGHRRLSILDLSESGKQPFTDKEGNISVSVNGEIYNYLGIKKELSNDFEFRSNSDSEVILYGYKRWGLDELLKRIDGMYAFNVSDINKGKIYLVRDRVGIKPLYYAYYRNKFVWASELKAIVRFYANDLPDYDYTSVYDFMTYNYVPSPKTLYKSIYKIPPASYLVYDVNEGLHNTVKYWKLSSNEIKTTKDDAAEHIKYLIDKSVREQLMSDVPVGLFLSGGLDSSTVACSASSVSNCIDSYSIGFKEEGSDETEYASQVSEMLGIKNNRKILDFNDSLELITKMASWYDEPFSDLSALPTYMVSKFARENATVVLTGDGGDEVFGGYQWYGNLTPGIYSNMKSVKCYLSFIRNKYRYRHAGRAADKIQLKYFLNKTEKYFRYHETMLAFEKDRFRKVFNISDDYDDYWYFNKFKENPYSEKKAQQYIDFNTYLHDDILTKIDRVSMSVSLEARVPLLSKDIIEYMFSLPEEIIYTGNTLKGLLKYTLKERLPSKIIDRKKKGFSIPLKKWTLNKLFGNNNYQIFLLKYVFKVIQ